MMRREAICFLVALLPVGGGFAAAPAAREDGPGTTFTRDVAPIVFRNCSGCHRPGGPGPFDLLTHRDVAGRTRQILEVVGSGFMPPWLPLPGDAEFLGERRLSGEEIDLIRAWVEAGAPEGDPRDLPEAPPALEGWQLGEPDLEAGMSEVYTLPSEGRDVFRNFVIPIPAEATRYVRAVELRPSNPQLIHHATMWIDRSRMSRRVDEESPEPGYPSMDPRMTAEDPDGHFLGWTPGTVPFEGYPDMAWRLEPGTDLVLQLHMLPTGKPEQLRCDVGFHFAEEPPTRLPFMLRLGSRTIDIPPGVADYAIEDNFRLPVDVEVLGVRPHAHYLGRWMEAWAVLPDGTRRTLVRMPWDFNWQEEYRYRDPIPLPAGSLLAMRYVYDNSAANPANPHHPPRRVRFGPHSSDEMGDFWVQVVVEGAAERRRLEAEFIDKERRALIAGYRHVLETAPDDRIARLELAVVLNAAGREEEAIEEYRGVLDLDPDNAHAHNNLGAILGERGERKAAVAHYRRALESDPSFHEAHFNLGGALLAAGDREGALRHYRAGLAIFEADPKAHNNLGTVLDARGAVGEALLHYREALRLRPDYLEARFNLGMTLARSGRLTEAEPELLRVVEVRPEMAQAHQSLGVIALRRGDLGQAAHRFRAVVSLQPGNAAARATLEQIEEALAATEGG